MTDLALAGFSLGDVLLAAYRTLLRREPDPGILREQIAYFTERDFDAERLLRFMLECPEFKDRIGQFARAYCPDLPLMLDVSQHGEVARLVRLFVNEAAVSRFVVDVGARGRERSNSYDLLRSFGWRGLLIEANPALIPTIRDEFAGLEFKLVHCAVSDREGEADLHFGINEDISSISRDLTANWGPVSGSTRVPLRRLPRLLQQHGVPERFDLLSLDIEGEDIAVLNDLAAAGQHRARWVLIEVPPVPVTSLEDLPFSDAVKAQYRLVERIGPNLVLRSREE